MPAPVRAPEVDRPGLQWFNVEGPLSLKDLKGRLVILDFWTFCCINCMHVIPILRLVEEAYPEELVVIGVHSPKFSAEADPERVRQAIARYDVTHPVVHDPEHSLWQAYAVRAWPTLVFIAPDGKVIGHASGEPDALQLIRVVDELVRTAGDDGDLAPASLALTPVGDDSGRFRYPAKIKPVPGRSKRWALADSGHHQIVLLDDLGRELARFGSGQAGFADGPGEAAGFNSPQGLVAGEQAIYVADTSNHAIRRIDLESGAVATLAGRADRGFGLSEPAPALETALASPWDLELNRHELYFANAGSHQLGVLDLEAETVAVLAGDGREAITDGPALEAQLAQPSGLALDGGRTTLYFADSETSSVRALSLDEPRQVTTLVGSGLFDFGHVNGPFQQARLQHALGLAVTDGGLLVADSYNGVLRRLDLEDRVVSDFDQGFECRDPVCLPTGEPAGVWADGTDRVFLVDTNNHRILQYRPAEKAYETWAPRP
jgi:thiol-disulfide isomerase/thioredoxin